jgi:hypothetical protein
MNIEKELIDEKEALYDKIDYSYAEIQKLHDRITAIDYLLKYGDL